MRGRAVMVGLVAGAGIVQVQASLWHAGALAAGALVAAALLACLRTRPRVSRHGAILGLVIACCLGIALGTLNAIAQALPRLAQSVPAHLEQQIVVASARILTLTQGDERSRRFIAEIDAPRHPGLPRQALVTWRALPGDTRPVPTPAPGERWNMTLVVRQPYAALNPFLPDQEGRWFAAGVRMLASVRGNPARVDDMPWASFSIAVERLRHVARERMQAVLGEMRQGPLLVALALGDGAGISRSDWDLFNRTGITHLVSISGLHVSLVAGVAGWLASRVWRRLRWRGRACCVWQPASVVGMVVTVLVAGAYSLLAGWSVPTRRTFFMLAAFGVAVCLRWPLSRGRGLALAAAVVVVLDPWAPLSPGFWLSFGAVAVLMAVWQEPLSQGRLARAWRGVRMFGRTQAVITLGMVPLLAWWTQQLSLVSPVANAIAIPVVSMLVTPLALGVAMFAAVGAVWPWADAVAWGLAWPADGLARVVMALMEWMAGYEHASLAVASAPWPWVLAACAGVVWALQAPGWPGRAWGWTALAPLVLWRAPAPAPGDWTLHALDIGQGTAVIVRTARHVMVYDTGPLSPDGWDAGERMVVPVLRALGVRALDTLVLSHADMDHVGGAMALLQAMPVRTAYASFDLTRWRDQQLRQRAESFGDLEPPLPETVSPCMAGQAWMVDDVRFTFLHPPAGLGPASTNARSCVLRVEGAHHSVLLPGDIPREYEARLAAALPATDLVLAAHHGSNTSSGPELVRAASAAHVVFQAGYRNRYGHPTAAVVARWRAQETHAWRTDRDGAITVRSAGAGLAVEAQREAGRRYWHRDPAG
ncbi:DNA internalization-related competence protein ComEC/Rec2 [Bordetella genomosp. 5]|uniref:DNA internalization-related competence protein ComEC/Rec2 n=1 Tax=Bordetella genomosp. 5 TaxID=1395608 RepID=A0A261TW74_9BORD|nr:DNA internalization-related competence protein ComEC/Rec2 [Bordetella genomosp. 5]OZI53655.1 DNA internalization-related competence protein ComEC/Rec2 [Bordetella genomosp. 5]